MSVIAVLAGRRPDPVGQIPPRLPMLAVPAVRTRVRTLFKRIHVSHLISSAACGADLIALDTAGELGVDRTVILPFDVERFRKTSVLDRPGNWGAIFDRVVKEVSTHGGLRVLDEVSEERGYKTVTGQLVDEAFRLGNVIGALVIGIAVWDGKPQGETDETARLIQLVKERGGHVREVSTLL